MKIHFNRGQRFSDIPKLCPIPNHSIINKAVPNFGATHSELILERNSIIVVPNIPVIIGKSVKHPNVLGVYNGTTNKQIKEYLVRNQPVFKKFITTPESFERIIFIAKSVNIDVYNTFFLLIDECDRSSKDVGFREKIVKPMKHLPLFKQYAFISATAFKPSDPDLKHMNVMAAIPNYSIACDINLVCTNHPYQALKDVIDNTTSKVFIFCSSLRIINKAIAYLEIVSESAIFCSEQRLPDMPDQLQFSDSMISLDNLAKYNFLTSRFYSAVDIDYDEDCEVVILTDIYSVQHTAVDPRTDTVQIIGRFRNESIEKSITVISNANPKIDYLDKDDIQKYITKSKSIYDKIKLFMDTSTDVVYKRVFKEYLDVVPFNRFIDESGCINHFLIDNFRYDNRILGFYRSYEILTEAYKQCKVPMSDIPYFNVNVIVKDYELSSKRMKSPDMIKTYRDRLVYVCEFLDTVKGTDKKIYDMPLKYMMLDHLKYSFPEIFECYDMVGSEKLLEMYSKDEVLDMIKQVKREAEMSNTSLISDIYNAFVENSKLEGEDIRNKLDQLFQKHGVTHIIPSVKFLRKFFIIPQKGVKGRGKNRNKTYYPIGLRI